MNGAKGSAKFGKFIEDTNELVGEINLAGYKVTGNSFLETSLGTGIVAETKNVADNTTMDEFDFKITITLPDGTEFDQNLGEYVHHYVIKDISHKYHCGPESQSE